MLDHARRGFLSRPDISALPRRVRARIRQREWANELLLRTIQLGIAIFFCFIYVISPKTYPDEAFAPAPLVLGVYLALSVIGLFWGWLREPPDWASYFSILFDFSLLYGLMISFHIQYGQPASFVLKAPTLLYVFIFIAIRALRFDPKFVLAAGTVAIIGWALVMFYVTHIDPADNMLTRSYVEYLTSNAILIGAEVDKTISILLVTLILAVAVNGASNLLVTAITEQSAAREFSRFFDASVASGIRSTEGNLTAGHGQKRQAAILNVDIRGFSEIARECAAGDVMRLLSAYQGRIMPLIRNNGGIIDKFMGDGIMAAFGIDGDGETIAADAVRAAEAILLDAAKWTSNGEMSSLGRRLEIGIGISTGTVTWGAVGHEDRLEMTVIGAPVNLSAKLEKHNKACRSNCIVDARTWKLSHEQGYDGGLHAEWRKEAIEGVGENVRFAILTPGRAVPAGGQKYSTSENT